MNKRTLTALQGSIEKWRQIANGTMADMGTDNCPLCHTFYREKNCRGCPVSAATGESGCVDTPYVAWREEQVLTRGALSYALSVGWCVVADTPELVRLAKREVKFLRSLLPVESA